eukprot:CCRYP_010921-RB/>CCRYP_010921-RB protein AED:0.15 eAED:0.15 QI:616/1/1/1/1/1/2/1210/542
MVHTDVFLVERRPAAPRKMTESTEVETKDGDVENVDGNVKPEDHPKDAQGGGDATSGQDIYDSGECKETDDATDEGTEDNDRENDKAPVIQAAPQAIEGDDNLHHQGSMDDLEDCKLTPLDATMQRQSMKDTLSGKGLPAPSLLDNAVNAVRSVMKPKHNDTNRVHFSENANNHQSSLHADQYTDYHNQPHNPNHHESALQSDQSPEGEVSNSMLSKFRRKTQRLAPGQGKKSHSHPRKSPFRSEIARLREQQRLEREKKGFGPEGNDKAETKTTTAAVGLAATTAPPDTASFIKQTSKLKHAILQSLGEFLTGAFADDEELSGSYFSQDLLDQISANDPSIKGIWLQAKGLNDTHVKQLCEGLIRNKVVTEVWLPSNQITDVGAGYIAHMLKFNRSIKELFLGENEIGPKGAAALASALARGNSTLVALGLGDNHIGVEGAGAFAAALRHNHTLSSLDIKNNGIPRYSSIRGLLHKMLEFNAADPGDESLVVGLQEELTSLISNLPPDVAEDVVLQAEEALKMAMLCRKRGDVVGAAEAEG